MRKLMTLDDLYTFFSSQATSTNFSVDMEHPAIAVSVPGRLSYEESDTQKLGLTPVVLKACHTGKNLNQSRISKETMEEALPSFNDRPILGYIWIDENGDPQFDSHNMHQTEDGELKYDEKPIGHIRENSDTHLEYDEEKDVYRVIVDGYIYDDYTEAVEILKRDVQCDVSVELAVLDLSYSAEEKVLDINKFVFTGVTILGKNEDTGEKVNPGMEGSNITAFESGNVITIDASKLGGIIATTDAQVININENQGKEGDATVDDVNMNAQTTEEGSAVDTTPSKVCKYSVTIGDQVHQYELTLADIQYAISELVNQTYGEADNCWYSVEVYPESNTVVMYDWWICNEGYRQGFEADEEGNYSLTGERESVKRVWVTEAEQSQIDADRQAKADLEAQLKEIQDQLVTYEGQIAAYQEAEAAAQRQALIASDDYAVLADSEEYQALVSEMSNYSVNELEEKLNALLLNYAKQIAKQQFTSTKTPEVTTPVQFAVNEKPSKKSPYGGLFD